MKNFTLILFSVLCASCSVARQVAPSEKIITETRIETVFETDTVYVEIPKIAEKIVTIDTVSVLENEFARSAASVSDGLLSHSLETKPVQKPIEVQTKIIYRDSVIVRDNVIVQTVEVEKELTSWQSFKMKMGGWMLGIVIVLIIILVLFFINPLKLIKL